MKNKWILKFGSVLLAGALMTGCGTVEDDNEIDQREDQAPVEENQPETDTDLNDNTDRNDLDQNDENDNQSSGDENEDDMNDRDMNKRDEEDQK